jgi:hypothetical protein
MADGKNEISSWFLLVTPVLIFGALHQLIPAIGERLLNNTLSIVVYYIVALILGIVLFRNARIVRDHEWFRRKNIKSLQKAYTAEDRGVWAKADLTITQMEAEAASVEVGDLSRKALQRLDGSVGEMISEKSTGEIVREEDTEEVHLLLDTEHVRRSMGRVTGEDEPAESVQGVTIEQEEQDGGIISGVLDRVKELQDAAVQASADEISTPVAPVAASATEPEEPVSGFAGTSTEDDWYAREVAMAGTTTAADVAQVGGGGNRCSACGDSNAADESYCIHCGNML